MQQIQKIINEIEYEISIVNKVIEREDRNEECSQYHRGERYALRNIKFQLNELLRELEQ